MMIFVDGGGDGGGGKGRLCIDDMLFICRNNII
jgi:hypothetical protein